MIGNVCRDAGIYTISKHEPLDDVYDSWQVNLSARGRMKGVSPESRTGKRKCA
jgi:hypothetical protein